jgi:uncharacterized protein YcfJ
MRNTRLIVYTISAIFALSGCAGANYRPLVDTKGVDMNQYESNLRECQQYATQVAGAGENAATGAVAGAVLGALLAGLAGKNYDRGATARVGALSGAVSAGAQGEQDQRNVIRNCMNGRGYRVLQ